MSFVYNNLTALWLEVGNNIWHFVRSTVDSIFYATNDTTVNGQIPLILKVKAIGGTQNEESLQVTLADMVYLSGKIVDNDYYLKLEDGSTGAPLEGYVKVIQTGQTIYTSDGNFTIRISQMANVTLQAQHIVGIDTLSFASSHDFVALDDVDSIILHPVTFYGMEQGQGPLFKMFFFLVNDKALNFPYFGKKYMDKNPSTHRVIIPLINDLGDTMTVSDQDSVENYLLTTYFDGMQRPPPIIKWGLNDTLVIGQGGGRMFIFMRNDGSNSGAGVDFNNDGIIDESYAFISKSGGPRFWWETVAQEVLTGESAPNNLNDSRLTNWTVLDGSTVNHPDGSFYVFDHKLRKIGENYPPKENIERILSNVIMIDP